MTTPTPMNAPVAEVTLFEDRAQVLRRGTVTLPTGRSSLRIDAVAPVLADRSIRARVLEGADHARLVDLRVRRERVASEESLPSDLPELRQEERQRGDALATLQRRRALLESEGEQLGRARAQLISELSEDAGWDRSDPERWTRQLAEIGEHEARLDEELLAMDRGLEEAERELRLLRSRILSQGRPDAVMRSWIEAELELDAAGAVTLELAYLVPGACWRPRYRARFEAGEPDSLTLELQASVWQHTGEDWADVALIFSTQRPSLGSEPPLLREEVLRVQPRREQVVVEVREQQIQDTGLGQARQATDELPGVDDGGETVVLRSSHPASVPSDGRPYRVAIGEHRGEARMDRVVMAELVGAALLRCTSRNAAPYPLLAGPVELVASSGPVGRSQLPFVSPGERIELGFGPDPSLRVFRRHERVEQESSVLSRWASTEHSVELLLSNIGAAPRALTVRERVPVSEIEQVEVLVDREGTSQANRPDADGVISWQIELPPGGTRSLRLAYAVRKRSGVVERG